METEVKEIYVSQIDFEDDRTEGGTGDLTALAENIRKYGLINPILVRKTGGDNPEEVRFRCIAGKRRLRAVRDILKSEKIEARIYWSDSEIDETALALSENAVREPMSPIDEGILFRRMNEDGTPVKEIAHVFQRSKTEVARRMQLSRLTTAWRKAFNEKDIDVPIACRIAELNSQMQEELFRACEKDGFHQWSVRRNIGVILGDKIGARFPWELCDICKSRTRMNDQTLFPDEMGWEDFCLSHTCYMDKWKKNFLSKWETFLKEKQIENPSAFRIRLKTEIPLELSDDRWIFDKFSMKCIDDDEWDGLMEIEDVDSPDAEWIILYDGEFALTYVVPYETTSAVSEEYKRECEEKFSSLPDDERDALVEKSVTKSSWDSDNPLRMAEVKAKALMKEKLGHIATNLLLAGIETLTDRKTSPEDFDKSLERFNDPQKKGEFIESLLYNKLLAVLPYSWNEFTANAEFFERLLSQTGTKVSDVWDEAVKQVSEELKESPADDE